MKIINIMIPHITELSLNNAILPNGDEAQDFYLNVDITSPVKIVKSCIHGKLNNVYIPTTDDDMFKYRYTFKTKIDINTFYTIGFVYETPNNEIINYISLGELYLNYIKSGKDVGVLTEVDYYLCNKFVELKIELFNDI